MNLDPGNAADRRGDPPDAEDPGAADRCALRRLEDENRSLQRHLHDALDRLAVASEAARAADDKLRAISEASRSAAQAELETRKDRFLARVSHELKKPLNLVQLNAELLVRLPETGGLPAAQRIGATLMQAVAAQGALVDDLLDLSRIRSGKMPLQREPTDLAALAVRLGAVFAEAAAGPQIGLTVDAPDSVICDADPVRLQQIVWNLLGNAVKFTGRQGRIGVRVRAVGDTARLVVSDTGIGIAPSDLPRVFDPFDPGTRVPPGARRTGLGIGLALVRELAQAHGGSAVADSPGPGLGATFTVEIPLCGRASTQRDRPPATPLDCRILLVDDSEDNLYLFAELLKMEGARVETTTRATEALEMLRRGHHDLLLSDIGMPDMSGLELIRQARALRLAPGFRSVAISGYGSESDKREALDAGFDGHLSKPVSIERLRGLLKTLAP